MLIYIIYAFSLHTLITGVAIVFKPVPVSDFIGFPSKSLTIHILGSIDKGTDWLGAPILFDISKISCNSSSHRLGVTDTCTGDAAHRQNTF